MLICGYDWYVGVGGMEWTWKYECRLRLVSGGAMADAPILANHPPHAYFTPHANCVEYDVDAITGIGRVCGWVIRERLLTVSKIASTQ
jgi:hypothetical protein